MSTRLEYRFNQKIGNNNIKYMFDVEPHITPDGKKIRKASFLCFCGNKFENAIVNIKRNHTTSCGCLSSRTKPINQTHGLSNHKLYGVWNGIKKRCNNKNSKEYKNYGGRGIIMCDEWKDDFKSFYDWALSNGYDEKLTLDRKDNDGNYEPSNCRWETKIIQGRNQRKRQGSSEYRGVRLNKNGTWSSRIQVNGKRIRLGCYDCEIEAARVRDYHIKENKLKGFILNFNS